jgi:hypothetical protein
MHKETAWIGIDLDGTLAFYDGWKGPEHIGEPIVPMLDHVKLLVSCGARVKIFTARACVPEQVPPIETWLKKHGIGGLEITNLKDFKMVQLYDDRCVQMRSNTGVRADGMPL